MTAAWANLLVDGDLGRLLENRRLKPLEEIPLL